MKRSKKIRTSFGPVFKIVVVIIRLFKPKPTIFNENIEEIEETALVISNHSGASGPMTLSLYYPRFFVPWGTHEMTGRYKDRWKYLYYVFYQQKLGYNKLRSFILATLFAIISKLLYKGMQLVPTYQDLRFKDTISLSIKHLERGNSILIFPEDSATGYHDELLKYHSGFVFLWQENFKRTGIDLPIYPIFYHQKTNTMLIGEKTYLKPMFDKGFTREQIANHFKNKTNELGKQLFQKLQPQPK